MKTKMNKQKNRGQKKNTDGIKLQLFLARAGLGARRHCETIIADGRVSVDGRIVLRQGVRVEPDNQQVCVDGRRVYQARKMVYLMLNKPAGYLCSTRNHPGENRPLVYDLLGDINVSRLFSVGRLDYHSSGLLLFSNDGQLVNRLSHPSGMVKRHYNVVCRQPIEQVLLDNWRRDGIRLGKDFYQLDSYSALSGHSVNLVLHEGKKREIRVVLAHFGLKVKKIHRYAYGGLVLGKLPVGSYRMLRAGEVAKLKKDAKIDAITNKKNE